MRVSYDVTVYIAITVCHIVPYYIGDSCTGLINITMMMIILMILN